MAKDPELRAHQEWIGYVQPVGLLVSAPALTAAQAYVNRNIVPEHSRFLAHVKETQVGEDDDAVPAALNLPALLEDVFGWRSSDLVGASGTEALPAELEVALPEYGETLKPTYAVRGVEPREGQSPWLMLIQVLPAGTALDEAAAEHDRRWQASPQARFERLLRETGVSTGLLSNGTHLRLVYAPRGESSGHATFDVAHMREVAGRPIFAALQLLLCEERLFSLREAQRLPAILAESRKYQNLVSTRLAGQVLAALYELLRGFQAADEARHGDLLRDVLRDDPNEVYAGLMTVLLRLIFVLYAEDRGLLSTDPVFVSHYSAKGLFERLRSDAGRFPDTMDQRYGAWAQLLALFRLVHDGGSHGSLRLPPRHGYLFNPDRYPFLEGRPWGEARVMGARIDPPRISDGVVHRVLENLLILDGERLSYRTLDVEQIGSVYETMMGFDLEVARGRSIAVKPTKPHGAPATVDLDQLLEVRSADRQKWLREHTGQSLTGEGLEALKSSRTPEDLVAALGRKVAQEATPAIVPPGTLVLQPSDERRRSGSHYTPRSLTEPIVRTTLRPVLEALGEKPTPEAILALKVCDPAMGSGAFLVEACRQLAEKLVQSWHAHGRLPKIPPDEDEVLFAQRQIAQRCLYGVDKNPMAVDLAKLSLWLATLAKDHPFTFLDHVLRAGDSLVGLTRDQIATFQWGRVTEGELMRHVLDAHVKKAAGIRAEIQSAGEEARETELRLKLREADESLDAVRLVGDLAVGAFFLGKTAREREAKRGELYVKAQNWLTRGDPALYNELHGLVEELRAWERPVVPFHWDVEFPEVFGRENAGFDAVVGNPPFAGKNTTLDSNAEGFLDWLKELHEESHGNSDLVAHFYRRAFNVIRKGGAFGLIATNTIGQGDTRETGLRWICTHGGTIYSARKRLKWPGQAAVVVSLVHVRKGDMAGPFSLDGRDVPSITAYLFHAGGHESPAVLHANAGKSFQGSIVLGMGFTFDDTDDKGVASPIAEMHRLIQKDPRNAERIFPYIGGEEINTSPTHAHHRHVINFGEMAEEEARRWPELMGILERKVKPQRILDNREVRKRYWWRFAETTPALFAAIRGLDRVLAIARVTQYHAFTFLPTGMVYSEQLVVLALQARSAFPALQSRPHEVWARFFGSTLEDRLRYTPSDCFETFPFPEGWETAPALEDAGRAYYDFRAQLMVRNDEGLTKTYNRFHDPEERSPDILKLRDLHAAMDRAVLDAYGWKDLQPTCDFLLDYEDDDDEDASDAEPRVRRRKKPWRYRWPDDLRDEVLARLLALNRERAEQERLSGAAVAKTPRSTGRAKKKRG